MASLKKEKERAIGRLIVYFSINDDRNGGNTPLQGMFVFARKRVGDRGAENVRS